MVLLFKITAIIAINHNDNSAPAVQHVRINLMVRSTSISNRFLREDPWLSTALFPKFDPLSQTRYFAKLGTAVTNPLPHRLLTLRPGGLRWTAFLKRGINYSASRASENGMWGPPVTPQDVCTTVNMLKGPVAQNFRNADV